MRPPQEQSLSESFIRRARDTPQRRGVDVVLRVLDIALSLLFLVVAAIPIALISVAILATSGTPLFYRGERVGRGGRFYTMLKFRTLRSGAEERLGPYLGEELVRRTRNEQTTVGRWLRATQLDELPQLWNVLTGDMSIVGPRPLPADQVAANADLLTPRQAVPAGMTGWWQINGRSRVTAEEALRLDLFYIENWSPTLDLYVLLKTFGVVVKGRGAY